MNEEEPKGEGEEEELFVFVSALGSEEIVKIRNAPLCTC